MNKPKPTPEIMPVVGMGATLCVGSDRYPYTIVAVSKSGKSFTMQADNVTSVSGTFQQGNVVSKFEPNLNGPTVKVRFNHLGRWVSGGTTIRIGGRDYYLDPHF